MLRNTENSFGSVAKFLHWLIALLVLLMLIIGISFSYLPKGNLFSTLMLIHKSTGVTILGLIIVRLLWRWTNVLPRLPLAMQRWETIAARSVHFLFYVLLLALPVSGMIMTLSAGYPVPFWGITHIQFDFIPKSKPLSQLMAQWHNYLAWSVGIFSVLHTLAALKHHYRDKDDVLKRMWIK